MCDKMAKSQNHNANSEGDYDVQEVKDDRLEADSRTNVDILKIEVEPQRSARADVRRPGTECGEQKSPAKDRAGYKS